MGMKDYEYKLGGKTFNVTITYTDANHITYHQPSVPVYGPKQCTVLIGDESRGYFVPRFRCFHDGVVEKDGAWYCEQHKDYIAVL